LPADTGLAAFDGPTGGYSDSFSGGRVCGGAFAEHGWDRRFLTAAAAMAIGSAMIMLSGWACSRRHAHVANADALRYRD